MKVELMCEKCGRGFPGRADARYCSPICRQQAYRARKAEARIAEAKAQGLTPARRTPLPDRARRTIRDLDKICGRLERVMADDRYPKSAGAIMEGYRGDLMRARETIEKMLATYP